MANPLLEFTGLPPFSRILPEHVEPAVERLLADNRARLAEVLADETPRTWAGVVQPVEDMDERLDRVWAPVAHLNSVASTPASATAAVTRRSSSQAWSGTWYAILSRRQTMSPGRRSAIA